MSDDSPPPSDNAPPRAWVWASSDASIKAGQISVLAVAYRWSLKASAWLWWPLALALAPALPDHAGEPVRVAAAKSTGGAWRIVLPLLGVVAALLIMDALPQSAPWLKVVAGDYADQAAALGKLVVPPDGGIRYVALWASCLLAAPLWWLTKDFKACYGKSLESSKEYRDLTDDERARFHRRARPIEWLRKLLIVALLVLSESWAVVLFHQTHPALVEKYVWAWLLAML